MTSNGILQITLYTLVILALAKPMGTFMAKVFEGQRTWLHRVLRPLETGIYRLCGIDESAEQHWTRYAGSLLIFSLVSLLVTYLIQRVQQWLPLNPQGLGNVAPDLSFNTAVSFTTNTNWQSYTPETTMSYLTQMVGLATHNFFSAAAGIVVAIAVIRGFARHSAQTIGNFWVDFVRCTVYVLLPISVAAALLLCSQGVIQNFHPYAKVATLEGPVQTIPQGPVASQEAIKMLGTNGGGFFNANSAHPYENPTPFSNFLQMVLIFIIPVGPDVHVRQNGAGYTPGLGDSCRHDDSVPGGRCRGLPVGAGGQPDPDKTRGGGRQHGRQGSALRHRRIPRSLPLSPRMPAAAPSTMFTTA